MIAKQPPNYCHVHNDELLADTVPILYGTKVPELVNDASAHRVNTYPHVNLVVDGPCWVEAATHAKVLFCPSCRKAWLESPEAQRETEQRAAYEVQQNARRKSDIARTHRAMKRQIAFCTVTGPGIGMVGAYFVGTPVFSGGIWGGLAGLLLVVFVLTVRSKGDRK